MIRLSGIVQESLVDGEGVRFVIFTQGCNHNCHGCHNPNTHDFNGGFITDNEYILDSIRQDPILDGVTLSGGDPFFQAKELIPLCKEISQMGLNIWAYTGFIFDEFLKFINNEHCDKRINEHMIEMLKYIDVVVDGPFILSKRTLLQSYIGSSNQRLINVKDTIDKNKIVLYELE